MSTVLDREVCTVDRAKAQRDLLYLLTFTLAFGNAFVVAGYINIWLMDYLKSIIPAITGGLISNAWIPAIAEPFTTKLLFGVMAYGLFRVLVDNRCLDFSPYRLRLGAGGGFLMGIAEVYLKLINANPDVITPFFWTHPEFSQIILLPLILHTVNGALVVGTFFSTVNDGTFSTRDFVTLTGVIAVAIGIHFTWNTWLVSVIP